MLWGQGFQVDWISFGKGVWSVLYSTADASDGAAPAAGEVDPREMREQQVTEINDKDPLKALNALLNSQWKDGRAAHQIVYGDGVWAVVTFKPHAALNQELIKSDAFPEEQISARWDRGFYIRSVVFGDNLFAMLFEEGDVPQSLFMDKNFPEEEIEDLWSDCYRFFFVSFCCAAASATVLFLNVE